MSTSTCRPRDSQGLHDRRAPRRSSRRTSPTRSCGSRTARTRAAAVKLDIDTDDVGLSPFHEFQSLITPDIQKKIDDAIAGMKAGTLKACAQNAFGGCKVAKSGQPTPSAVYERAVPDDRSRSARVAPSRPSSASIRWRERRWPARAPT